MGDSPPATPYGRDPYSLPGKATRYFQNLGIPSAVENAKNGVLNSNLRYRQRITLAGQPRDIEKATNQGEIRRAEESHQMAHASFSVPPLLSRLPMVKEKTEGGRRRRQQSLRKRRNKKKTLKRRHNRK